MDHTTYTLLMKTLHRLLTTLSKHDPKYIAPGVITFSTHSGLTVNPHVSAKWVAPNNDYTLNILVGIFGTDKETAQPIAIDITDPVGGVEVVAIYSLTNLTDTYDKWLGYANTERYAVCLYDTSVEHPEFALGTLYFHSLEEATACFDDMAGKLPLNANWTANVGDQKEYYLANRIELIDMGYDANVLREHEVN